MVIFGHSLNRVCTVHRRSGPYSHYSFKMTPSFAYYAYPTMNPNVIGCYVILESQPRNQVADVKLLDIRSNQHSNLPRPNLPEPLSQPQNPISF